MQLNKDFVRSLKPSLTGRLRHGDQLRIAKAVGLTPLSVRNAIAGATTNEKVIREAFKIICEDAQITAGFLQQIPAETLKLILKP